MKLSLFYHDFNFRYIIDIIYIIIAKIIQIAQNSKYAKCLVIKLTFILNKFIRKSLFYHHKN